MKRHSAEGLALDPSPPVDAYLGAFLQHFLPEAQEPLLHGGLVESQGQEVCEGLLLTEAVQENVEPRAGRGDAAAVLPCDHYEETEQ